MPASLPARPNLEWLRKTAKDRLTDLRVSNPRARLADAQLAVARDYGFPSWRQLKAHVERLRRESPTITSAARLGADVNRSDQQREVCGRADLSRAIGSTVSRDLLVQTR
jgi:hypothetical protein